MLGSDDKYLHFFTIVPHAVCSISHHQKQVNNDFKNDSFGVPLANWQFLVLKCEAFPY